MRIGSFIHYAISIVLASTMLNACAMSAQDNTPAKTTMPLPSGCKGLKPESKIYQKAWITESGCYFLEESFDQGWLYDFSSGGRKGPNIQALIDVVAADVDIDLKGRTLKTDTYVPGIVATAYRYNPNGNYPPLDAGEVHKVTIRNGTIQIKNSYKKGSGRGVHLIRNDIPPAGSIPKAFKKTQYILDNLTIKAANVAALLIGDGMLIRNCTIEVDAEHAIIIFGPNAVIENNRIIYRFDDLGKADNLGTSPFIPAAIYLNRSDHSVIRGNSISIEGGEAVVTAVALVDSQDVRIEDNHLKGEANLVVTHGTSRAVLKNNYIKESRFKSERALPDRTLDSASEVK